MRGGSSSAWAAAAPTTPAPACSPRSGSARRSAWRAAGWRSASSPPATWTGSTTRPSGCRDVELVCATDVDTPLLGLQGASAIFGPQKGATPEQVQALEAALGHFADVVRRTRPEARDLLTGDAVRVDRQPGAGAAGGLGYGLMLLGGRRVSGVEAILSRRAASPALLAEADLVVTGEGRFDWQSLRGKVVTRGRAGSRGATAYPSSSSRGRWPSGGARRWPPGSTACMP